jgi:galactose-1-phosphate uridylyltransferase
MEHYLGVARENRITEEEIGAVQGICMAVSAGRINAQLREVETQLKEKQQSD